MLLLFIAANAQSKEQIYYYFKGQKVYYPVSYDRLIVGIQPGHTFKELRAAVAALIKVPADSLEEAFGGKQILVKLGINKVKDVAPFIAKLKQNKYLLYARPVFKSVSGNYNSYGDEFIVNLKASTSFATLQNLMNKYGVTVLKKYPFEDDMYVLLAGAKNDYDGLKMANLFYETGLFDYAEPNKAVYNALHSDPNDPLYNLQWAHKNTGSAAQFSGTPDVDMKVQEAWATTMGSINIKIGVIDEGVDLTHPDLQANLLQGFNGETMTSNPGDGAPTTTTHAHGTNCAGIIAAIANNNIGVAGVAPNCKIIPAVIFGGTGITSTYLGDVAVAACFDYVRLQGADVISNSWGGGSVSSTIDDAIHRAVTLGRNGLGSVVLFSSGNDNGAVSYPANNTEVISVGGISMCGQRKTPASCDGEYWWGANYGTGLDVVAPCVKIPATDIQGTGGYNTAAGTAGDYYNIFNGTSSACPNTAGVMALILSANSALTVAAATMVLELSCTKLPNYNYVASTDPNEQNGTWNNETGFGNVNAQAAVQLALNPGCVVQIVSPSTKLCSEDIQLSVFSPYPTATYQWRKNGIAVANGTTLNVNTAGNYDVVMTKNGCNASSNIITITSNILVTAQASTNNICNTGSSILTASVPFETSAYCTPSYSNGTVAGDYISLVSIDGTSLNNASIGAASPYYTLYPKAGATTASLLANTAYTLTVKGGEYQECYITAWIDYNQDGVFDASESVGVSANVGAFASGSFTFTLPANVTNGITRLRLRSSDTSPGPGAESACSATNSSYGETEDYIITITKGAKAMTYAWTEDPAGTTLQSNNTAVVTAANINQTTTYTVTATSAAGCVSSASQTVTVKPLITWYQDADGDGYGNSAISVQECEKPDGYVNAGGDCSDNNATIYPGAPEICGNGTDDNCDGQIDEGCVVNTIQVGVLNIAKAEGKKQNIIKVKVGLNKKTSQPVTVNYATQNVTATAGTDYVATSGTVTFAPGVKLQTISVTILGDKIAEPDETFKIVLSNPVNASIAPAYSTATCTLVNDDGGAPAANPPTLHAAQSKTAIVVTQPKRSVTVSPNPATTFINVQLTGYTGKVKLQLHSTDGRIVKQEKLSFVSEKMALQKMSVTGFATGTYLLMVIDDKGNIQTEKVVIVAY